MYAKKLWKIYKYIAIACFSLLLLDAATVVLFSIYRPAVKKADAIIVLGAAINTPALDNRSLEGLRLYEQGKADAMVVSGGRISDKYISEAEYMQKIIRKSEKENVPIILDSNSHNTYENIKNSKALIPNAKSVIVVSDEYHLARGVLLAKRAGFEHVEWSAPKPSYYKTNELIFYYIREMAAMVEYIPKFIKG